MGSSQVEHTAAGPAAVGEGFKTRSAELLQPLQMHVLDHGLTVLPVTASLNAIPAAAGTSMADSADAAAALQKQTGPFIDSLSDGMHCDFMVD